MLFQLFLAASVLVTAALSQTSAHCRHYGQYPLDFCKMWESCSDGTCTPHSRMYSCNGSYPMRSEYDQIADCSGVPFEVLDLTGDDYSGVLYNCDAAAPVCEYMETTETSYDNSDCSGSRFFALFSPFSLALRFAVVCACVGL